MNQASIMNRSDKPLILVVQDSRVLSKVIEQKLIPFFRVELIHDGEEALASLLGGGDYSAVVLDLALPKMDGMEVLRTIRDEGITLPVIIATNKPIRSVEGEAKELGVEMILSKPLDFDSLIEGLQGVVEKNSSIVQEAMVNRATGKKYPFRVAIKFCFICGYEKVNVFLPIREGISEDWVQGSFPIYSSTNGYEDWDGLKSLVAVCPYCLFASMDPNDFADNHKSPYPYSEESKKILTRSMSFRKRLVPEALDIEPRFDSPFRSPDTVMVSLVLAEKCCNGLILAGKQGAYAEGGLCTTLIGALKNDSPEYYREALTSFENQLKHKDTPRRFLVKTYFFCIVLNMHLNRTSLGRDIMKKVEDLYANARYEEISEEEREWLMRINYLWKNGMGPNPRREIL